jgi:uncharacterized protein YabE (DUF348 family)
LVLREETGEKVDDADPLRGRGRSLGLLTAPIFVALAAVLIVGYQQTLRPLTVVADGRVHTMRTHQTTVEAVLREAGLALHPKDVVEPGLEEPVRAGGTITVQRARPVVIQVDGQTLTARTQMTTTEAVLAEMGVEVGPHDVVEAEDGIPEGPDQLAPLHIEIHRAVPIVIQEAGHAPMQRFTSTSSVGEALYEAGIVIYLADEVRPPLSSPIEAGTRIAIERSIPVTIHADGRTMRARTHSQTVGDVLSDVGVSLQGLDYAIPDLARPLGEGGEIRVVRVQEELVVQQEPIAFQTQWAPNGDLEIDHQQLGQQGEPGVYERRVRVRYEDGAEVNRWVEAEWVAKQPRNKILEYGTKIVLRTIDTPSGAKQYWRKLRMLATSYNAASAGKSKDDPYYGITALGWKMRKGIVAVDPDIVPLGSQVYVPGYGVGDAADTGGAIDKLRIDLGYDDHNLVSWYRCVDVYLLAPVPDNVQYVMTGLVHPRCR